MRALGIVILAGLHSAAVAETAREPRPILVATGGYYAPQFAPDGETLLVTGERMHGLALVTVASGDARTVTEEPRAGASARFLADGRVAFAARRAGAVRTVAVDAAGAQRTVHPPDPRAFAHGDRVYVRTDDGIVPVGTGDRFFGPTVSPNGARVAFVGLATGVYVYDVATGAVEHLGPGTAPAWSPDSTALAFERTDDDGHAIVGSDIWVWRAGNGAAPLMATARRTERRPSWSPDGARLAFDDDRGSVYVVSVGGVR